MRIVISGTHASGKSTLVTDFATAHPDFDVLTDPFELIDAAAEAPDAETFSAQLQLSASRLLELAPDARVIAERGPLDFLAYLEALDSLRRPTRSRSLFRRGIALTAEAMTRVNLLALLPLADDADLVGPAEIVELTGDPSSRLTQLETAVMHLTHRR